MTPTRSVRRSSVLGSQASDADIRSPSTALHLDTTAWTISERRREARRYLKVVFGAERRGILCLAIGHGGHFTDSGKYEFEAWRQRFYEYPDDRDRAVDDAIRLAVTEDVFIATTLLRMKRRQASDALPTDTLWVDIDGAPYDEETEERIAQLAQRGMRVSSGRNDHLYPFLSQRVPVAVAVELNRRLADHLKADKKFQAGTVLRLPGTLNHKPRALGEASLPVRIVSMGDPNSAWTVAELDAMLPVLEATPTEKVRATIARKATKSSGSDLTTQARLQGAWKALLATLPEKLQDLARERPHADRSRQSMRLAMALCAQGCSDAEFELALNHHQPTVEK
ncbi:MAG: hypothetical protein AB7N61_26470, partial [Acidimicrobiia bacterium]